MESHPDVVEVTPQKDYGSYCFYTVYWKESEYCKSESISVFIYGRDGPDEAAYWHGAIPKVLRTIPSTPFRDKVTVGIDNFMVIHPTIDKVIINSVDETNKTGMLTAYVYDDATETDEVKQVFVYEDENQQLVWRILK